MTRTILSALTDALALLAFAVFVGLTAPADADLVAAPVALDVMAGVYAGAQLGTTP